MNWGYKIVLAYIGFVALIVVLVIMSMREKSDLVSKDYYAKELNFQSDINSQQNAKNLKEELKCTVLADHVELEFPSDSSDTSFSGNIYFYKPSNAKADVLIPIKTFDKKQTIPFTSIPEKGMYKVIINWENADVNYQTEKIITIP